MSLTEELIAICRRPVGPQDSAQAQTLLLDWLGVAFAGTMQPAAAAFRAAALGIAPSASAIAVAIGRTSAEQAAFLNGSLGTLLEMDDLHRRSILHAGDVIIPAALAAAAQQASGQRLLEATLFGYEVALRIGSAAARGGYTAWYNSGTCGVFGAAMAASHALGLDERQKRDALGQAGMQAGGLWQCRLEQTDSKALATAHAARAGITSALLAGQGLRGARHILEGDLGFFRAFYPDAQAGAVAEGPDADWMIHEVSIKPWPACRHVHAAIGAALDLRQDIAPDDIARIVVHTYAPGQSFCDTPRPETDHEARFSFQHALAVVWLRGAPRMADFGAAARTDPAIAALRDRVEVLVDPALTRAFPARMGARLEVELKDGTSRQITAEHAPGDPESPIGTEGLDTKFRTNLAAAGLDDDVTNTLKAAVGNLAQSADLTALNAALDGANDRLVAILAPDAHTATIQHAEVDR